MKTLLKFLFVGSALILSCATTKAQVIGMINNVAKASAKASAKAAKAATFRPNILTAVGVGSIHAAEQLKQTQKQKTIKVPKLNVVDFSPKINIPKDIKYRRIKTDTTKVPLIFNLSTLPLGLRLLQEKLKDTEESKIVTSIPDESDTPNEEGVDEKEEEDNKPQ